MNIEFQIEDRYSGILVWKNKVQSELKMAVGVPGFPAKKVFGVMDPAFIE